MKFCRVIRDLTCAAKESKNKCRELVEIDKANNSCASASSKVRQSPPASACPDSTAESDVHYLDCDSAHNDTLVLEVNSVSVGE